MIRQAIHTPLSNAIEYTPDGGAVRISLEVAGAARLREPFDLVLLDMPMPRMSGLEMLRELRRQAPGHRTPMLVLSNSSRAGDREGTAALGVAGYMVKASLSLERLAVVETTIGGSAES